MKKRYRLHERNGMIYILRFEVEGLIFGPAWNSIATFDSSAINKERCKQIIRLLNECDKHSEKTLP